MKHARKPIYWCRLLLIFCFSLTASFAGAQEKTIQLSGTVSDAQNQMLLPGVNIAIKGTNTGASTNLDGKYQLSVKSGDVLVFSFLGYQTYEATIADQLVLNVQLNQDVKSLEEVVVVGYGVQKKKLSTGATVEVKSEDLQKNHSLQIEQALQGLTPGVQITSTSGQPGESLKVRIRGLGTNGNADPLFVVDGVPTYDISYLNPADVSRIDVLKDAASSAIYGTRGANGVILISTKKGKAGELKLSLNSYYGIQNQYKKLPMLGAKEYGIIVNEAAINSGRQPYFNLGQLNNMGEGTDWQEATFGENVPLQNHVLSFSGGNEKSVFSGSVGYQAQEGIIGGDQSAYSRISFRLNSGHQLFNWLKIGENLSYSRSNRRGIKVGNIYSNSVRGILSVSPVFNPFTEDGEYAKSWFNADESNPLASLDYQNNNKSMGDRILGNLYMELDLVKGLKFRTDFGIDLSYNNYNSYSPIYNLSTNDYNSVSTATQSLGRNQTWNWENYFTYDLNVDKHQMTIMAGISALEENSFGLSGSKGDLILPGLDFAIINNGTNEDSRTVSGYRGEHALFSMYGRINYNYDQKYLFTATFRRDGSTRFGKNNRYANFPSFSAGWVVSEEEFYPFHWMDYLKLRASWGRNGNENIGDFQYLATIQSDMMDYYFGANENQAVGASPDRIPNPNLRWETSEQVDIGLDAHLLKGFRLAVDWYRKTTKDWLVVAPIPALAGTGAPTINGGDVENQGLETALSYHTNFGEWQFGAGVNFAYNQNEVLSISNAGNTIQGNTGVLFNGIDEFYRAQAGHPIGFFYGLQTDGIFQNEAEITAYSFNGAPIQPEAEPGDVRFVDQNGDGSINAGDKVQIGNPNPDWTYGFNLDLSFKGWDFSTILQGVAGNQLVYGVHGFERPLNNYSTAILNRWTGEGTSNHMPRVTMGDEPNRNWTRFSDLYVHSGSFLRIKSVNLGYNLKQAFKNLPVQKLRVYVSATNLFTFTDYPGMDPEIGYGNIDQPWSSGVDLGFYPQPRTFLMGVNVQF